MPSDETTDTTPMKLAVIFIHGIGDKQHIDDAEKEGSFMQRIEGLKKALTSRQPSLSESQIGQVAFDTIIWQQLIQGQQNEIFSNVEKIQINQDNLADHILHSLNIGWFKKRLLKLFKKGIRKEAVKGFPVARSFLLSSLGDVAAVEHKANAKDSVYTDIQKEIREALAKVYGDAKNRSLPVIIIAQSYGAHLISNYIWDIRKHKMDSNSGIGIWRHEQLDETVSPEKRRFLQLETLEYFFTTGNNMALFLSGLKKIKPIESPNPKGFIWINYWDQNDVMGWPLKHLRIKGHDPEAPYAEIVNEEVDVLHMEGAITHFKYWEQPLFIDRLAIAIAEILRKGEPIPDPPIA